MPTAPEPPAIVVSGATKRYGRIVALDHVDLQVERGSLFALLGPNGAGKTTLIHVLCTIHGLDEGRTQILGVDVAQRPRRARQHLGVVFQEPSLDGRLTVHENLDFHGRIYGVPRKVRARRIRELLEFVELEAWRDHLVRELSAGMKRRLEIARALVHDARVLILDEPTVGLDAQTRERMWVYLQRLRRERDLTILVTTHYIDEVEVCDQVCIIDDGSILAMDTPRRLKEVHGTAVVRAVPLDVHAERAIRDDYPDKVFAGVGDLVIEVGDDEGAERFTEVHGRSVKSFTLERPSLETVFLSLTGHDIRDRAADAREQMYGSARRGGEPTR